MLCVSLHESGPGKARLVEENTRKRRLAAAPYSFLRQRCRVTQNSTDGGNSISVEHVSFRAIPGTGVWEPNVTRFGWASGLNGAGPAERLQNKRDLRSNAILGGHDFRCVPAPANYRETRSVYEKWK